MTYVEQSPASQAPTAAPDSRPWSRAWDHASRAGLATTALLGVLVAVATSVPRPFRDAFVLTAFGATLVALAWTSGVGLLSAWRRGSNSKERALALVATAGIGIGVLTATQLEIIRLLYGRPALTWHIDWRTALDNAQAIARYDGLGHSLDYPGVAITYHVGPDWLAGTFAHAFGHGLMAVEFGLVPLLCVLAIALAAIALLQAAGLSGREAAAATGVALNVPATFLSPRGFYADLPHDLLNAELWPLGRNAMLNDYFALAIGLAAVVLILEERRSLLRKLLGIAALGSVLMLKPQYFVGLGLLVGLIGVARVLYRRTSVSHRFGVLFSGVAALAAALALRAIGPPQIQPFAHAVLAPGHTGYGHGDAIAIGTLAGVAAASVWAAWWRLNPPKDQQAEGGRTLMLELLLGAVSALVLFAGVLYVVKFPTRPDLLHWSRELGFPAAGGIVEAGSLGEGIQPLRALAVFCACGVAAALAWRSSRTMQFVVLGLVFVVSPVPLVVRDFAHPDGGHQAADDVGLLTLLRHIPRNGTLLIASDLADPAEGFARPLNAVLLSGYDGHTFYIANMSHHSWTPPDAPHRIENLERFFGSNWSSWSSAWLRSAGVTDILVDDRCVPKWVGQARLPLELITRSGRWTAYRVDAAAVAGAHAAAPPAWSPLRPRYGAAACLTGRYLGATNREKHVG